MSSRGRILNKAIRAVIAAAVVLATLPAVSAIPYRTAYDEMAAIDSQTKELNMNVFARMQAIVDANRFNVAQYVPYQDLRAEDAWEKIARNIFKHTMQSYIEDDNHKDVGFVRSVQKVDKSLSTNIDTPEHHFRFRIRPAQTAAVVSYSGPVTANLSYDIVEAQAQFELAKNIGNKTVSYTHSNSASEIKDIVGVRWTF